MRQKIILTAAYVLLALSIHSVKAEASEAKVRFGSNRYMPVVDTVFPLGVYLESADKIGTYTIKLTYDAGMIAYQDGATQGGDGTIILSGDLQGTKGKFMLHFSALKTGQTSLQVAEVVAYPAKAVEVMQPGEGGENGENGENGQETALEAFSISALPAAPITVQAAKKQIRLTGLRINGIEVDDLDSAKLTGTVTIPYAENVQIEIPEDYKVEGSAQEWKVGENMLKITLSDKAGTQAVYSITVNMETDREAEALPVVSGENAENGGEKAPEPQETGQQESWTQGETGASAEADEEVVVYDTRESFSILRLLIVILTMILVLGVTIGVTFYVYRNGKQQKRVARRIKRRNSEIKYESLEDD